MKTKEYILGVAVTTRSVYGVLVHDGPEGPIAIAQYSRPRSSLENLGGTDFATPETDDPDVRFTTGPQGDSAMFLSSEFDVTTEEVNDDGQDRSLGGFSVVDWERVLKLDDATLADWTRAGLVEMIQNHRYSLQGLSRGKQAA